MQSFSSWHGREANIPGVGRVPLFEATIAIAVAAACYVAVVRYTEYRVRSTLLDDGACLLSIERRILLMVPGMDASLLHNSRIDGRWVWTG